MIFGRDPMIDYVAASARPLAIIAADAGVGKSAVLAEVARRIGRPAKPVAVQYSPGALQEAMLQALASAVAETEMDESGIERLGRILKGAVDRATSAQLKEVGRAVGGWLVDAVRKRLGDSLAESLERLASDIATSAQQQLSDRLRAATNPDVVDTLIGFAGEVREFCVPDQTLVVCLDDLDRLHPDDARRLADLINQLPAVRMRIIGTFQTSTAQHDDALLQLESAGADVIHMQGLTTSSIEAWLISEQLDPASAAKIERLTSGYALDVSACLDLVQSGEPLPVEAPHADFSRVLRVSTQRALRDMPSEARRALIQLSPYGVPLSDEEAAGVLDIDLHEWGAVQIEFMKQHLFIGEPPWFHGRRLLILDELLLPAQVLEARRSAIKELGGRLSDGATIDIAAPRLAQLASLVEETTSPSGEDVLDRTLAEIGSADRAELALLGALIELAEVSTKVIEVQHVVMHAHDSFGVEIDQRLVDAVETLASRAYIASARNENAHLLGAGFGSTLALNFAAGRVANVLGRLPIPGLASQTFEASVRPLMIGFTKATFGIGQPDIRMLIREARELQIRSAPNVADMAGFERPNLLIRVTRQQVPIYGAVAFSHSSERDDALARLLDPNVRDPDLRVEIAHRHPGDRLRSRRFIRALGRALGARVSTGNALSEAQKHKLGRAISLHDSLQMRLDARRLVRGRMNDDETLASDLTDEAPGFLFCEFENGACFEAHVAGFGAVEPVELTAVPFGSLVQRIELMLKSHGRVGKVSYHSRRDPTINPVVEEVVNVSTLLRAYNDLQRWSVRVPLSADPLRELVANENRDCEEIARDFRVLLGLQQPKEKESRFYFLSTEPAAPNIVPGAMTPAVVVTGTTEGESVALVSLEDNLDGLIASRHEGGFEAAARSLGAVVRERFGLTTQVVRWTQTGVRSAVASAMGYDETDLWLDR